MSRLYNEIRVFIGEWISPLLRELSIHCDSLFSVPLPLVLLVLCIRLLVKFDRKPKNLSDELLSANEIALEINEFIGK